VGIVAVSVAFMRTGPFAQSPDLISFGITFDICVGIPALYYLLVVRRGSAHTASTIAVFVASLLLARAVVPVPHRDFLNQLGYLLIPIETGVVLVIVWRVRAAMVASRGQADVLERIVAVTAGVLGRENRISRIASMELAALILGLGGWWMKPPVRRGIASTTFHERSGWGSIVGGFVVVLCAEMIAVHLLIQQWSHTVAWVVTGLEIWGVVWLLGDYHAFRLRRFVVTEETVELRFGFRWSATFSRALVTAVEPMPAAEAAQAGGGSYLRLSVFEDPEHVVRLSEAVLVTGMMGFTRSVTTIGLSADDPSVIEALAPAD
jgi:hypothetical protein